MIDLVLRGRAEPGLLLLPLWTFRHHFSLPRLQFESPFHWRRCARTNLHVLASSLKSEHLHFEFVASWREIRQLVIAGLIGGRQSAMLALGRDHGGARQRLAAELDGSSLCDGGLRQGGLPV